MKPRRIIPELNQPQYEKEIYTFLGKNEKEKL